MHGRSRGGGGGGGGGGCTPCMLALQGHSPGWVPSPDSTWGTALDWVFGSAVFMEAATARTNSGISTRVRGADSARSSFVSGSIGKVVVTDDGATKVCYFLDFMPVTALQHEVVPLCSTR